MFVPPFYVGRKRTAGSPAAAEEQHRHATTTFGASQICALFELSCANAFILHWMPLAHAAPRLLLHVDTTTVAPRRLRVLQQRILRPTHPRVALRTLSATAAMDLAICSGIAQAKGHTLQPTMGMLVLLIMKMNILLVLIMQGLVMTTTTRMRKFLMRVQRRSTGP